MGMEQTGIEWINGYRMDRNPRCGIKGLVERVDRAGRLDYTSGMRATMIFFLCILVALQGMASPRLPEPPCPMMQSMSASMADMDGGQLHDCCTDVETALKTGQPCKSGQVCSAPAAWALTALPATHFQSEFSSDLASTSGLFPPSHHPAGVWRPPTLG